MKKRKKISRLTAVLLIVTMVFAMPWSTGASGDREAAYWTDGQPEQVEALPFSDGQPDTGKPEETEPVTEAPEIEEPETEEPETEETKTEEPETEEPETEEPETEVPEKQEPETEAPETQEPETEAPDTEALAVEEILPEEVSVEPADAGMLSVQEAAEEELFTEEAVSAVTENVGTGVYNALPGEKTWSFDTYYVGQPDSHYVEKTADFSLKYQMEFHASQDLRKGAVSIKIPKSLLLTRDNAPVLPADIAVPRAEDPEHPKYNEKMPFNYYEDEEGNFVFFNYREITSGTNAAFQVLYKDIRIINLIDNSQWSLQPEITVDISETEEPIIETEAPAPLEGKIDSYAQLSSVTKRPYYASGKSYTPGLYTKAQVENYIDYYASPEIKQEITDNFDAYKYIVWEVTARGNGNQPWSLEALDTTGIEGEEGSTCFVAGYGNRSGLSMEAPGEGNEGYTAIKTGCRAKSWTTDFYVVAAYPKDSLTEGKVAENDISIRLIPYDGIDPVQEKSASAKWSYVDYDWHYRGDIIGIGKWNDETYNGWLEVWKSAVQKQQDKGDFPFTTTSDCYGYGFTHNIAPGQGELGAYQPNTSYKITTVDDVLYAYPDGTAPNENMMLGKEDYYFSAVSVSRRDTGYDVWEDRTAAPEAPEGIDQTMYVYAMFEEPGANADEKSWEQAVEIPYASDGTASWTFTPEQLARHPWRVKAEYRSVNYHTACTINVKVRLKWNSPKLKEMLFDESGNSKGVNGLKIENISGVMGERFTADGISGGYFHEDFIQGGNYGQEGLEEATEALYGTLLQRDNAFKTLTGLTKEAASYKTARTTNDPDNSRSLVTYNLTAYDGYRVYGQEAVDILKEAGVETPGRNYVAFYDLLPYGIKFDASAPVTAGRITSLDRTEIWQNRPGAWNKSQVKVTVEPSRDVTENWRNTGRTMVVFHVSYTGADAAVYTSGRWMEGWGVSFQAYYDWKDVEISQSQVNKNICAFMPDNPSDAKYQVPLVGEDTQVAKDNGEIPNDGSKDYQDFASGDLNGDRETEIRNVLYAKAGDSEDIAIASRDYIEKLVRADADVFAPYGKSASVRKGEGYTYDITVTTIKGLKDLVVFDRLENASTDRKEIQGEIEFADSCWTGAFAGIVTRGLEAEGIAPVIYYNGNRNADLPQANVSLEADVPEQILTEENGWFTQKKWTEQGKPLSEVQAVALDLRKSVDGQEFHLEAEKSVTFQIKMTAPKEMPEDGAVYAYNNPSYYSTADLTQITERVVGNSVKVSLGSKTDLIVEKEFSGEVPESLKETSFGFALYRKEGERQIPFANREYELFQKDAQGQWMPVEGLFATDYQGRLYLKAGQRARFPEVPEAESVFAEEEENPFWKTTLTKTVNTGTPEKAPEKIWLFANAYRPVVYVQKLLQTVPEDKKEEAAAAEFTFQITDQEGNPLSGKPLEYWYVDSPRTDGGIPAKDTSKGENGVGYTEADGSFTIKEGDILALFPGELGAKYQIREIRGAGEGTDWLCKNDTVNGTAAVNGTTASITNMYRYRDLYLTKTITHQTEEQAKASTEEFTFQVLEKDGEGKENPVTAKNPWMVMGEPETEIPSGTLDESGSFTAACGGRIIKISGLDAEKTYVIRETKYNEALYQPVNGGSAEVTMPLYALKKETEITNDYLLRPLSVTKTVAAKDQGSVREVEFTFTLTINGAAYGGKAYTVTQGGKTLEGDFQTDEAGQFTLKNGQTAHFPDAGRLGDTFRVVETPNGTYPQLYPVYGENANPDNPEGAHTGAFAGEGNAVSFINGSPEILMVGKDVVAADRDNGRGQAALEAEKTQTGEGRGSMLPKVTLCLEIQKDGAWTPLNNTDNGDILNNVQKIDTYQGTTKPVALTDTRAMELAAGELLLFTGLSGDTGYRLSEAKDSREFLFWYEGAEGTTPGWVHMTQKEPSPGVPVTGTVESQPAAKIVNEVKGIEQESVIYKVVAGLEQPPAGSALALKIEEYNGSLWRPRGGIPWFAAQNKLSGGSIQETGEDGKLLLKMPETGSIPRLIFPENKVTIQPSAPKKGDLRIVELPYESSSGWGFLKGYGVRNSDFGWTHASLSQTDADIFVNSVQEAYVEVEKTLAGGVSAGRDFTFVLEQVTRAAKNLDREEFRKTLTGEDILETTPGKGIAFTVYDRETNACRRSGTVNAKGEFTIKDGEYARFSVAAKTCWLVTEKPDREYHLTDLTGNTDSEAIKLNQNWMLLYAGERKPLVLLHYNDNATPEQMVEAEDASGLPTPTRGGYRFGGWYADPDFLTKIDGPITTDMDAYAKWTKPCDVKYAVSIYGIQADSYKGGGDNKAALTFGPATGGNYVDSFVSHTPSEGQMCMHNMTWTEIIAQSRKDPSVFRECMKNGCTHSVELALSEKLKGTAYPNMTGDGAGVLCNSINQEYRSWNSYNNGNYRNTGGWPASRIRATLNGYDEFTDTSLNGSGKTNYAGSDVLSREEALISCFPEELQAAIVPKEVKSDTVYNDISRNNQTTYDCLWLFSTTEIYKDGGSNNSALRPNEGILYERQSLKNIATSPSSQYQGNIAYNDNGSAEWWWLRSASRDYYYSACNVNHDGDWNYRYVDSTGLGLAPGFSIH